MVNVQIVMELDRTVWFNLLV